MDGVSRRDVFRRGGLIAAGVASAGASRGAPTAAKGSEIYTRIGVRPFINCTATYTINGGSHLHEIFSSAGSRTADKTLGQPLQDISGAWDVDIRNEVGSARHKLFLTAKGNRVAGSHEGWAFQGDLKGEVAGDQVTLRSSLPAEGTSLAYVFRGALAGSEISGDVDLGEYGRAKFHARRHA